MRGEMPSCESLRTIMRTVTVSFDHGCRRPLRRYRRDPAQPLACRDARGDRRTSRRARHAPRRGAGGPDHRSHRRPGRALGDRQDDCCHHAGPDLRLPHGRDRGDHRGRRRPRLPQTALGDRVRPVQDPGGSVASSAWTPRHPPDGWPPSSSSSATRGTTACPCVVPLDTIDALAELAPQVSFLGRFERPLQRLADVLRRAGGAQHVTYREAADLEPVLARAPGRYVAMRVRRGDSGTRSSRVAAPRSTSTSRSSSCPRWRPSSSTRSRSRKRRAPRRHRCSGRGRVRASPTSRRRHGD